MHLACPPTDAGILSGTGKSDDYLELLNKAIYHHRRHLEVGPDSGGHFVANTNLGRSFNKLLSWIASFLITEINDSRR